MITALWVFAAVLIFIGLVLFSKSRKELNTDDPQEFKRIKSKWQIIFGLLGLAIVIVTAIAIFMMFKM